MYFVYAHQVLNEEAETFLGALLKTPGTLSQSAMCPGVYHA